MPVRAVVTLGQYFIFGPICFVATRCRKKGRAESPDGALLEYLGEEQRNCNYNGNSRFSA
jgi:hypothetical protein